MQLGRIYSEMLQVFKSYSEFISSKIMKDGPEVCNTSAIRAMLAVKKEILKLIQCFIKHCAKVISCVLPTHVFL